MPISNANFQVIEEVLRQYTHEAYTTSKNIHTTGVVGTREGVDGDSESYIGQFRWYKPLEPEVNVMSTTDDTEGTMTNISTNLAKYIKTARSHGAEQVNVQQVLSRENGLEKIARDFAQTRMEDEGKAFYNVLQGVARSEVALGDASAAGEGGLVDFDTDPDATATGFFVDLNAASGVFGAAATGAPDQRKLFDASGVGAARGERLFQAIGMAFKDYEPDYMYMVTSPETLAQIRAANLVDEDRVTDGELEFTTIFDGKFRLLPTRFTQMASVSAGDLNARSTKCTFLMKPNSVSFAPIEIPTPVEMDRDASVYLGGGKTEIWYRWGYVWHPEGYAWAGAEDAFATNATFSAAASWTRKVSALNLPILPIYHA